MQYLKIENVGVAPVEGFTLIGASTKDVSNSNTIGRFGTGNKQGISLCLRHKVTPVIFLGNLKMEFSTSPFKMSQQDLKGFNCIYVKYSGRDEEGNTKNNSERLGYVVENGQADWKNLALAFREFISNSLDRVYEDDERKHLATVFHGRSPDFWRRVQVLDTPENLEVVNNLKEYRKKAKSYEKVCIEIVEENQVRAKAGCTRIFVPCTPEVYDFYQNVGKWFLHFSNPELIHQTILPKDVKRSFNDKNSAMIYRRGVFVRQVSDKTSLFDYNLEDLSLDESRQVDDWTAKYQAAEALGIHASEKQIEQFIGTMLTKTSVYEFGFYEGELGKCDHEKWSEAFRKVVPQNFIFCESDHTEILSRKGFYPVVVPDNLYRFMNKISVSCVANKVLTSTEQEGFDFVETPDNFVKQTEFVWALIEKFGMTNGKEIPKVNAFNKVMTSGVQMHGFWSPAYPKEIFLHVECDGLILRKVILEELTHYVTGATDCSRDFQDFILRFATHLMN